MLKIIKQLKDLNIRQLMAVYEESNKIFGAKLYPNFSDNLQILYAEQDFYAYLEAFFEDSDAMLGVWAVEDEYRAALRVEQYQDGLIITGLETAPGQRKRGYASALVRAVIDYLKKYGPLKLYSHIEKSNAASLRLHQGLGFRKVSDTATYIDGSFHTDAFTFCLEILK